MQILQTLYTFFVFNFLYLLIIQRSTEPKLLHNGFSRLKALDIFFNLSLIIDEILKIAYKSAKGGLKDHHYISESLLWLVDSNGWMNQADLECF